MPRNSYWRTLLGHCVYKRRDMTMNENKYRLLSNVMVRKYITYHHVCGDEQSQL